MPNSSAAEITKIQQALAHKGFDPGQVDGVWGRRTELAVKRFQLAKGLTPDGIVGPNTRLSLFGVVTPPASPLNDPAIPWLQEARRLVGMKEKPGPGSNPEILDWAEDLDLEKVYTTDSIAWCGLFIAHCIASTLSSEPLPVNPLGARNWARWGSPCTPQPGALIVFWRGKPDGWQGHVGFYAGQEADGTLHILGGNQGDQVSVARMSKDRVLATRWPATATPPSGGPQIVSKGSNILSTDEA